MVFTLKMDKVTKTLKENLHQQNGSNIDAQLANNCARYFTERVEFTPPIQEDLYIEKLRQKYKPINPNITTLNSSSNNERNSSYPHIDGIPTPRQVLFNPQNLCLKWLKTKGIGSGLSNMGNTCFLNSVIQCLTYTPPLFNYLFSDDHKSSCNIQGFCSMCELYRHITRVMNSPGGSVKPIPIVQNLKAFAKHFRYGRQEDAHEFLRYFIDSLQRVCLHGYPAKLDIYSKHTTVVHQIFGGYHRSQVKCFQCHRTSDTFDPILDISLDIKGCSSLLQALQRSIKPDLLDEENKYACPYCKKLTRATKQLTIHTSPNVLTLQLKRFEYNSIFGGKINKMISYPRYLDLRPYMSDPQGPQEWYQLYAVLVHFGFSCHSGHYYCYVRNSNGIWYSLNDSMVSQVGFNTVQSQEAYLLFYIKDNEYTKPSTYTAPVLSEQKKLLGNNQKHEGNPVIGRIKRPMDPFIIPRVKPTGIVNPSPQKIPPPPPTTPPITTATPTTTTTTTSVVKPLSFATPSSLTTPKSFTPRCLVKTGGISSKTVEVEQKGIALNPTSTLFNQSTPTSLNQLTPTSLNQSTSTPLNQALPKNPQVALVHPLTHVKPTARVHPNPQQNLNLKDSAGTLTDQSERAAAPSVPASREQVRSDSSDHWDVSDVPAVVYGPSLPPDFVESSSSNWTVTSIGNTCSTNSNMTPETRQNKVQMVFSKNVKNTYHRHHKNDTEENSRSSSSDSDDSSSDEKSKLAKVKKYKKFRHRSEKVRKRRRDRSPSLHNEEVVARKKKKTDSKSKHSSRRHHHKHHSESNSNKKEYLEQQSVKYKKHSSTEKGYKEKRIFSSSEEKCRKKKHKPHSSSEVNRKSKHEIKSVPELKWDESRHSSDHHDNTKSTTILDSLEKGEKLGQQVETWDGKANSIDTSTNSTEEHKRYGRDEWDTEIDRGKVKKLKKRHSDDDWCKKNRFQAYQNKKNSQSSGRKSNNSFFNKK